jgi:hypothetical protein
VTVSSSSGRNCGFILWGRTSEGTQIVVCSQCLLRCKPSVQLVRTNCVPFVKGKTIFRVVCRAIYRHLVGANESHSDACLTSTCRPAGHRMDKTVADHGRGRCRGGICHLAVARRRPPLLFVLDTVRNPSNPNFQVSLETPSQILSCLLCRKGGACGKRLEICLNLLVLQRCSLY